ncbi:MAG: hypothetical protein AAF570_29050, partial [Bacteroidota bacterium]
WQKDLELTPRRDRKPGTYHPVQHHFPVTYGLGPSDLPASAPAARQGQVRQLRGYLLFFEQLLANYFAQLENAGCLLSFSQDDIRTYFFQSLVDKCPSAEELLNPLRPIESMVALSQAHHYQAMSPFQRPELHDYIELCLNGEYVHTVQVTSVSEEGFIFYVSNHGPSFDGADAWRRPRVKVDKRLSYITEPGKEARPRKNRFLNHLLARFSEDFSEYSLLLHRLDQHPEGPAQAAIDAKLAFLRDYVTIGKHRAGGLDYTRACSDPDHPSGFLHRVARKLGMRFPQPLSLTEDSVSKIREIWDVSDDMIDRMTPYLGDIDHYQHDAETNKGMLQIPELPQQEWPRTIRT